MDVRYINPFIYSIKNVFQTMLSTDIFISKPCIKQGGEQTADFSALIGLSGDAVGTVALCFPTKTATRTAGKFAGMELTHTDPDFVDALGELANMVAGGAKAKMDGLNINISLPQVISGSDLRLMQGSGSPTLLLPCDSSLGRFNTEVTMVVTGAGSKRKSKAAAAAPA